MVEIRIDITSEGPETVVHVSGRLAGALAAQLLKACESIAGAYVLDLSNLMFTDDTGVDAIRTLVEKGAEIRGASPFIKLLINDIPGKKVEGR
jgi:anti-anti-sigma regulatory factor